MKNILVIVMVIAMSMLTFPRESQAHRNSLLGGGVAQVVGVGGNVGGSRNKGFGAGLLTGALLGNIGVPGLGFGGFGGFNGFGGFGNNLVDLSSLQALQQPDLLVVNAQPGFSAFQQGLQPFHQGLQPFQNGGCCQSNGLQNLQAIGFPARQPILLPVQGNRGCAPQVLLLRQGPQRRGRR